MAVLGWKRSVGSWLQLTSAEIVVRNPFEVVRIPLQEVTDVCPAYKGLVITLANRD